MMEYNNYYQVQQSGQPPPPPNIITNHQSDYSVMGGQMMTPNAPNMMQPSPTPSTPHSMHQTPSPMPIQQHMGSSSQMQPQQQPSPHLNYHQRLQQSPLSHSASPHPSSTPHNQQPPSRPSTGPSPIHHQSPIHMNGPSPKLHSSLGPYGQQTQSQPHLTGGNMHMNGPTMHSQVLSNNCGFNRQSQTQNISFMNSSMPTHGNTQYGQPTMHAHHQNGPLSSNAMNQSVMAHQQQYQQHHQHGHMQSQHQSNFIGLRSPPSTNAMQFRQSQSGGYMVPQQTGFHTSVSLPPQQSRVLPQQSQMQNNRNHQQDHQQHVQSQYRNIDGSPSPSSIDRGSPFCQHIPQTEFRIIKLNKRLQNRPRAPGPPRTLPTVDGSDDITWWKQFASDFFDNEAIMTLRYPDADEKSTEYTVGRTLIPRFFKSYFDGGVIDFSVKLTNVREISDQQSGIIQMDCDQTDITTNNFVRYQAPNQALSVVVHTKGHLVVDFASNNINNNLLIKSWKFYARRCHEYVDRSLITAGPATNVYLVEPVTRFGLTKSTYSFLKMCMIMEPMQDLMLHHRQTSLEPRACLKQLLFERYKLKSVDDTADQTQPVKRRRPRKTANANNENGNGATSKRSKTANPDDSASKTNSDVTQLGVNNDFTSISLASQDILVVGEPMLGADFGDENERRATRLENDQFDTTLPSAIENSLNNDQIGQVIDKSADQNKFNNILVQVDETVDDQSLDASNKDEAPKDEIRLRQDQRQTRVSGTDDNSTTNNLNHFETATDELSYDGSACHNGNQVNLNLGPTATNNDNLMEPALNHETSGSNNGGNEDANNEMVTEKSDPFSLKESDLQDEMPSLNNETTALDKTLSSKDPLKEITKEISKPNTGHESSNANTITNNLSDVARSVSVGGNTSSTKKNLVSPSKQNRRRSSERRETFREGLMRTSDFVVAMKDLQDEPPKCLWRITTGNNLLQQFDFKDQNGVVLFENTTNYAGWNPEIRKDYIGVDVRLTQHTRNQITVERLLLNFHKIEEAEAFYDKHFAIFMQILLSISLDPKFWEDIEVDKNQHHLAYFKPSRRIIDDIIKRHKQKLANKLKLGEIALKQFEKYPNLVIKELVSEALDQKSPICRGCNINLSTQEVSFEDKTYDMYTFKPVKVANELVPVAADQSKDQQYYNLCNVCLDVVKLFSEVHHMGWKFFNLAREKIERHKAKGKPINTILDEIIKDEEWMLEIFAERDRTWHRADQIL